MKKSELKNLIKEEIKSIKEEVWNILVGYSGLAFTLNLLILPE